MKDNWKNIIQNKFLNEELNAPNELWERINDNLWTKRIQQKFDQTHNLPAPPELATKIFIQNQTQPLYRPLFIKGAAILVGAITFATGWYHTHQKNKAPQTPYLSTQEQITDSVNKQTQSNSDSYKNENIPNINSVHPTDFDSSGNQEILGFNSNLFPLTDFIETPLIYSNRFIDSTATFHINEELSNIEIKSQFLRPHVFNFSPSSILNLDLILESSLKSYLKPKLQIYTGIQKTLNTIQYTNSIEKFSYQHTPKQRSHGVLIGASFNNGWFVESGLYQSYAKSNLNFKGVSYFKTPVKINPQLKLIEIKTPYIDQKIDARQTELLPPGANWRDTNKYYKVNYIENYHVDLIEIPLSVGYKLQVNNWLLSAQLGGLLYMPRKLRSDFTLQFDNPKKTTFTGNQEKIVRNKYQYHGFAQIRVGYRIVPDITANIDMQLPQLDDNNPNEYLSFKNVRYQLGLNYYF